MGSVFQHILGILSSDLKDIESSVRALLVLINPSE